MQAVFTSKNKGFSRLYERKFTQSYAGSPIVLCFTDTYHSQSRLMAQSYVVLVLLQYCVSRTHILSQGWSHATVLCLTDTYHSHSRLMAHSYVVLVLLQYCVSRTHILSQGWSHPTVLCFTDTYHSHSRLMAHSCVVLVLLQYCVSQTYHSQSRLIAPYSIVFHRHISFSFKADGAQLCCAGSPIVFCVTWHTFSVKADGAHLCYIIILSVYFTVGVMS